MRCLLAVTLTFGVVTNPGSAQDTTYTAMFWNVHSGNSEAETIGRNMAEKGAVDFWGLSEVPSDPAFIETLEEMVEDATGVEYTAKMSEDGGNDRIAILFNSDRLTSEPYDGGDDGLVDLGENFFEVTSVNTSGTVRPSLGVQLNDGHGQSVVVLVNHWKAKGDPRSLGIRIDQAEATNTFVHRTPGLPVIIGGDHNIPIRRDGGAQQQAFDTLTRVLDYLAPDNAASDVASFRSGSLLDSVFVAHELPDWESTTTILNRVGNRPARTSTFRDNNRTADHRPVRLVVTSDTESRIEALEEQIRATEALLEQLQDQLEALQGNSD